MLALLLEHPGRLVTRDELRRGLWPSNTFVDFDRSLNKAVNRLREALGRLRREPSVHRDSTAKRLPFHRSSRSGDSTFCKLAKKKELLRLSHPFLPLELI